MRCSGNTLQTCNASGTGWTNTTCPGVCVTQSSTTAVCGACSPGATACTGNQAETCNASGQWVAGTNCSPLNKTCSAGSCVGVCAPGDIQCVDSNSYKSCDGVGQYTVSGGKCTDVDPADICGFTPNRCGCVSGTAQCTADGYETCDASGNWSATSCISGRHCCYCNNGPQCIPASQTCLNFCPP
jgi:hypothetical protein